MNFGEKIKSIIKEAGYSYKIRYEPKGEFFKRGKTIIRDYEKVTVYAGRSIEKPAQRQSLKLVAYKDLDGKWQGDLEAVEQQGGRGDKIYLRDYHDKTEPLKYVMYSDCDWNDDEKYAKNALLKVLENWKLCEEKGKIEKEKTDNKKTDD